MSDLRALVFEALNRAKENGYAGVLSLMSPEDCAADLLDYDWDIGEASTVQGNKTGEDYTAVDLISFIEEYRKLP